MSLEGKTLKVCSCNRTLSLDAKALAAWAVVGIPILWGVWVTMQKTAALFN